MIAGYRPALDGLRAVSILLVLAAHAGLARIVPGGLGVTIFFFVSGYLIAGQLLDEHARHGRIALGRFYRRRALRLLPAAFAYVAVAGLVFTLCGGRLTVLAVAAAILEVANLAELFTRAFDTTIATPHPFVVLWSLAIEEHAYLIGPPLLALALTRSRHPRRVALAGLLALCLGSLAWRATLADSCVLAHGIAAHPFSLCGTHLADRIFKGTDTRLDSIAYGALAALAERGARAAAWQALLRHPALRLAAALAFAASLGWRDPFFRETARTSLQGTALLVLVPALLVDPNPLRRLLSCRAPVAIGRLSYGLYLWHWLALMLATRIAPEGSLRFLLAFSGLTACGALASWHALERPLIEARRRLGSVADPRLAPEAGAGEPAAPATPPRHAVAI